MHHQSPYTIERSVGYPSTTKRDVLLLFSGGRDSSCAAVRLLQQNASPLLLTVIDSSFQTDEKTEKRVRELQHAFGESVCWISAIAPDLYTEAKKLSLVTSPSCLDCFFVRLSVAIIIAREQSITRIATGFTSYQATWIEQSPTAIAEIRRFLAEYDLTLSLPVHDLACKGAARALLSQLSLSPESLEPACHCSECGTKENAVPEAIKADTAKLITHCRGFLARFLSRGLKI